MKIKRTILPHQAGAKAWKEKYGSSLVCIRYRYDEKKEKKLTTVEIIVKEQEWKKNNKIPPNKIMPVIVMFSEVGLTNIIKNAGGYWNKDRKVWELPYREILSLGLEDRIVAESVKKPDKRSK